MKIVIEGIIESEIVESAKKGEIYPHVICGVDLYRTKEAALEDEAKIDLSRPFPFEINSATGLYLTREMYFSNRHYRILHLLNQEEYDPQTTIADVIDRMKELQAKGAGFVSKDVLEQEDVDTAYVLTPLDVTELKELGAELRQQHLYN